MDVKPPRLPAYMKCLEAIEAFYGEHGFAPNAQDICERMGISPKSKSAIPAYLDRLEEEGFIRRPRDAHGVIRRRGVVLLTRRCPRCGELLVQPAS